MFVAEGNGVTIGGHSQNKNEEVDDMNKILSVLASVLLSVLGTQVAMAQDASDDTRMSFFISSIGPGNGAALGGLDGADRHCQALAEAAGAGDRTWRAYLSTSTSGSNAAVNARDRIGQGPWYNARGVLVARNVDELHGDNNNLSKQTSLNEKGEEVNGRGDNPNMHDILTGSQLEGTAFSGEADMTCENWTSSGAGSAWVGHHDQPGRRRTSNVMELCARLQRLQPGRFAGHGR